MQDAKCRVLNANRSAKHTEPILSIQTPPFAARRFLMAKPTLAPRRFIVGSKFVLAARSPSGLSDSSYYSRYSRAHQVCHLHHSSSSFLCRPHHRYPPNRLTRTDSQHHNRASNLRPHPHYSSSPQSYHFRCSADIAPGFCAPAYYAWSGSPISRLRECRQRAHCRGYSCHWGRLEIG